MKKLEDTSHEDKKDEKMEIQFENVSQDEYFSEVPLNEYLSKPIKTEEERIKKLDILINKINRDNINLEELPLHKLKQQRITFDYLKLDTSFLSMYNKIGRTKVPKFSVYPVYDSNTFKISSSTGHIKIVNVDKHGSELIIPKVFRHPLMASLGLFDSNTLESRENLEPWAYGSVKLNFREFLKSLHLTNIISRFNGIIPYETRQKIEKSMDFFKKNELYIIAETKPEEWSNEKIIYKDPLLVGEKYDACFLIDHFNTTSLEHYVASEFINI